MLEELFVVPDAVERHRSGPLGGHVDAFCARLTALGYAHHTLKSKLWLIADLGRWMQRRGCAVADLDAALFRAFLEARRRGGRSRLGDRRTLEQFLEHLRAEGVVPLAAVPRDESPVGRLLEHYEHYLRSERALVDTTVTGYRHFVRALLLERFGAGAVRLDALDARVVCDFVLSRLHTICPKRAQYMASALRSFLRFLFLRGETRTDLSLAIPTVRQWRLSTVPRHVSEHDVEQLLATSDRTTSTGRRNHAILLLLARLGLRAGEVVALELGDLHWRAGELVVRGKGGAYDHLPLPPDVGRALALYLTEDRPRTASRRVFLGTRAPYAGFADQRTVGSIVRRAFMRAGLRPAMRGAHVLRHSLAATMLRRGASLAEVGQVLRHRSPNTTEIYAKLDFAALRAVALPWPGHGGGR